MLVKLFWWLDHYLKHLTAQNDTMKCDVVVVPGHINKHTKVEPLLWGHPFCARNVAL